MDFFQSPTHKMEVCKERLAFYYQKMTEYDEEEREDWQGYEYIKGRVSFWKAEMLKAEEDEYFKHLNEKFNIE